MNEAGFANGFRPACWCSPATRTRWASRPPLQQMWGAIGMKLELQQVDNATRTAPVSGRRLPHARSAPGPTTSPIRAKSPRTSPISRPSDSLAFRLEERRGEQAVRGLAERDRRRRNAPSSTRRCRRSTTHRHRSSISTRRPIRWRSRKNVKGFVQIPLGNNIFAATYLEK